MPHEGTGVMGVSAVRHLVLWFQWRGGQGGPGGQMPPQRGLKMGAPPSTRGALKRKGCNKFIFQIRKSYSLRQFLKN